MTEDDVDQETGKGFALRITKKRMAAVVAPMAAAVILTGVSTPEALAASKSTACSASINPSSDAKITARTYYMKKTSTTWQHTSRYYYPSSHGFKKSRSDFKIISYLLDGTSGTPKGMDKRNKGEARWDMVSFSTQYPTSQRPITKKGTTRLVAEGWYNMDGIDGWPVDCKGKSFAF
ncbi:hypothetical protein ACFY94_15860 [Streptomyces griseorubiginosus]|uniref:hypothetical protein n=1 Tax=Streptomyces griseorubiginosus TaxID=67304 RepID=UPI0036ED2D19